MSTFYPKDLIIPASVLARKARCSCEACLFEANGGKPFWRDMMNLCPKCGNKRCPHVENHRFHCTGSNAVGQKPRMSIRAATRSAA